jgi:hypothetical protein
MLGREMELSEMPGDFQEGSIGVTVPCTVCAIGVTGVTGAVPGGKVDEDLNSK